MENRKQNQPIYFRREVKELFSRVPPFRGLSCYDLISHLSGRHEIIIGRNQANRALYFHMAETNKSNGENKSAAIPMREGKDKKILSAGENGGRFFGIRRIPPTAEGRKALFDYRKGRAEYLNKLIDAHGKMLEADKAKGILTEGQVEKIIGLLGINPSTKQLNP